MRVVGQGGDGGTVDIGFGCLSGMFERNDDVLFVCYDNEAYMNTGVQRSGATPAAARTTTTPVLHDVPGNALRPGQEPAADRHGARDPLRRHGHDRGPARPRGEGRARHGAARRALPPRARDLPARLGHRACDSIRIARLGGRVGPVPGVRGRARRGDGRHADPPPGAGGGVPAAAAALRPSLRARASGATSSTASRPRRPERSPASGCSPTRRLRDGQAVRDHARSRDRASPTRPARGGPSGPSTPGAPRRARTPARPARSRRTWLYHAEEGDYEARVAGDHGGQPASPP